MAFDGILPRDPYADLPSLGSSPRWIVSPIIVAILWKGQRAAGTAQGFRKSPGQPRILRRYLDTSTKRPLVSKMQGCVSHCDGGERRVEAFSCVSPMGRTAPSGVLRLPPTKKRRLQPCHDSKTPEDRTKGYCPSREEGLQVVAHVHDLVWHCVDNLLRSAGLT